MLWRREKAKPAGIGVVAEEVEHGLSCHDGSGRNLGHLYVMDGQIDAMPDFDTMLPDRLVYIVMRVWLLAVGLRAGEE